MIPDLSKDKHRERSISKDRFEEEESKSRPDFLVPVDFGEIVARTSSEYRDVRYVMPKLIQGVNEVSQFNALSYDEQIALVRLESGLIAAKAIEEVRKERSAVRCSTLYRQDVPDDILKIRIDEEIRESFTWSISKFENERRAKSPVLCAKFDEHIQISGLSGAKNLGDLAAAGINTAIDFSSGIFAALPSLTSQLPIGDRQVALFYEKSQIQRDALSWLVQISRLHVSPFYQTKMNIMGARGQMDKAFSIQNVDESLRLTLINKEWIDSLRGTPNHPLPWTGCPGLYLGVIEPIVSHVRSFYQLFGYAKIGMKWND